MAKIRKIGDKKKILKELQDKVAGEGFMVDLANLSDLDKWLSENFKDIPVKARPGLALITKATWANTKAINEIQKKLGI